MRDIPGYEGLYAITPCGKVWSYRRNKFIKSYKDSKGYYWLYLKYNGKRKFYRIHRLVALTYIPNPNNYPEVNHKDEIKDHNFISNLEWCTSEYNNNYGTRNSKISKSLSKKVLCLSNNTIYNSIEEAGKILNIDSSSISKVCLGKRNSVNKLKFKFMEEKNYA